MILSETLAIFWLKQKWFLPPPPPHTCVHDHTHAQVWSMVTPLPMATNSSLLDPNKSQLPLGPPPTSSMDLPPNYLFHGLHSQFQVSIFNGWISRSLLFSHYATKPKVPLKKWYATLPSQGLPSCSTFRYWRMLRKSSDSVVRTVTSGWLRSQLSHLQGRVSLLFILSLSNVKQQ